MRRLRLLCLLALVAAASEGSALAQRGGREAGAARRQEHLNRQAQQHERDHQNRDLDPAAGESAESRRTRAATAAQVRHDFESLQESYNRIVLAMSGKQASGDSLSGALAEVSRCAARLKHNLALPRPKDDEARKVQPEPGTPTKTDKPLVALVKHLHSFLTNPLFETTNVLDVSQAARASRDLERIIELSEALKGQGVKLLPAKKQ